MIPSSAIQTEMTFPMTEQEEYENAGLTEEQKMHIEENTLSTPEPSMKQLKIVCIQKNT